MLSSTSGVVPAGWCNFSSRPLIHDDPLSRNIPCLSTGAQPKDQDHACLVISAVQDKEKPKAFSAAGSQKRECQGFLKLHHLKKKWLHHFGPILRRFTSSPNTALGAQPTEMRQNYSDSDLQPLDRSKSSEKNIETHSIFFDKCGG